MAKKAVIVGADERCRAIAHMLHAAGYWVVFLVGLGTAEVPAALNDDSYNIYMRKSDKTAEASRFSRYEVVSLAKDGYDKKRNQEGFNAALKDAEVLIDVMSDYQFSVPPSLANQVVHAIAEAILLRPASADALLITDCRAPGLWLTGPELQSSFYYYFESDGEKADKKKLEERVKYFQSFFNCNIRISSTVIVDGKEHQIDGADVAIADFPNQWHIDKKCNIGQFQQVNYVEDVKVYFEQDQLTVRTGSLARAIFTSYQGSLPRSEANALVEKVLAETSVLICGRANTSISKSEQQKFAKQACQSEDPVFVPQEWFWFWSLLLSPAAKLEKMGQSNTNLMTTIEKGIQCLDLFNLNRSAIGQDFQEASERGTATKEAFYLNLMDIHTASETAKRVTAFLEREEFYKRVMLGMKG